MNPSVLKLESFLTKTLRLAADQARRYFKDTFGLSFEAGQITRLNDVSFLADLVGVVTLRNDQNLALLFFTFDRATIGQLLSQVYRREPGAISDDSMKQGIGEITSVIYASVRKILNESGQRFDRVQPSVFTGQELTALQIPFHEIVVTQFREGFLFFKVGVILLDSEDSSLESLLSDLNQSSVNEHRKRLKKVSSSTPKILTVSPGKKEVLARVLEVPQLRQVSPQDELKVDFSQLYHSLHAVFDTLGQGILVFGADEICLPVFSRACMDLLEMNPSGRSIGEVLKISREKRGEFSDWISLLFEDVIGFEDWVELGPKQFSHTQGRVITLEFKPLHSPNGKISGVVLIATDRTQEHETLKKVDELRDYAEFIVRLAKDKNQFLDLVKLIRKLIRRLRLVGPSIEMGSDTAEIGQILHTVKGGLSLFALNAMRDVIHEFESKFISSLREFQTRSLRISDDFVESLYFFAEALEDSLEKLLVEHELILGKDFELCGYHRKIPIQRLYRISRELLLNGGNQHLKKYFLRELVAVPISQILGDLNPGIKQLAMRLGKRVGAIEFRGHDLRILPEVYGDFFSTLVHVFFNSIDHGIEDELIRIRLGKPPVGRLTVQVSELSYSNRDVREWIELQIEDDGRGINPDRIREKLVGSEGLDLPVEADEDVIQHIFDRGFSTRSDVSVVSGRGVGLDAVKSVVERLQGSIRVYSELGKGTVFRIEVPYLWSSVRLSLFKLAGRIGKAES